MFKKRVIKQALQIAEENWRQWQDVFENGGLPILNDIDRFRRFASEYSVGRTIRSGTLDAFRICLLAEHNILANADTGEAIDRLDARLRRRFGTESRTKRGKKASPRSIVSVLSKVAVFVRPERFVAWDRFAKKGLNKVLRRPASRGFESYSCYLEKIDQAWDGSPGESIREYRAQHVGNPIANERGFQRRILDVCLMLVGKRDFGKKKGSRRRSCI